MGWKTLKKKYAITHIVHVRDGMVYIGSPMVSELAWIDPRTGEVGQNPTFKFLEKAYPELLKASPDDLLATLKEEDAFSASIPVFTYEGGNIIEKVCEDLGFPNVTHDGELMYENTFSTDRQYIVDRAKRTAELNVKATKDGIERLERDLEELKVKLAHDEAVLAALQSSD